MVPSLVIALIYQDEDVWALGKSILLLAAIGAPMRFGIHSKERNLRAREGFLVVALAWVALSCFGALPFVFSGCCPIISTRCLNRCRASPPRRDGADEL